MKSESPASSAPKYLLAEKAILDGVKNGRFPPGSRLPSDRELAKTLQIAPLTLGNAMRRLCERGILDRRPRVGTFVRTSSQAPNIAILVLNSDRLEAGLSRDTHDLIEAEAATRGHQVRAMLMPRSYPPLPQLCEELRAMRVGAVGLLDFLNTDRDYIAALSKLVPCVLFNKGLAGVNLPCATPDMFAASRLIVDHFLRRGRKSVAAGVFHIHHQRHVELSVSLEAECLARGLRVDKALWHEGESFDLRQGAEWIERLCASGRLPDALVTCGGLRMENLIATLDKYRLELGRDIEVVALRLASAARRNPVDWPVIAYDDTQATTVATSMLCDIAEGKLTPADMKLVRIAPELILPQHA